MIAHAPPLSVRLAKHGTGHRARWVILTKEPGEPWPDVYDRRSYGTRREAMSVVESNLASGWYPPGTEVLP